MAESQKPSQRDVPSSWGNYLSTYRFWTRRGQHESSMQDQHDQIHIHSVNPEPEPPIHRNLSSTSLKVDLKSELGKGAFAKVYVGRLVGSDEECAVKIFNDKVLAEDVEKEFKRMHDLKHPNIVCVFGMIPDYEVQGRNAFAIVMELCDMSLDQYIKERFRKGISKAKCLQILHDVASAMVCLHSQDTVHGDLRSPNVLVKELGDSISAKITDFGMMGCLNEADELTTTTFADAKYLPPEVFVSSSMTGSKGIRVKLSRKVDVFCFGPIAIELGCGEFPEPTAKVNTKRGVVVKTFSEIQRREKHIKKVRKVHSDCIELIVEQCMQDRPEERTSFSEILLTVEGFQKQCEKRPNSEWIEEKQRELEYERKELRTQLTLAKKSASLLKTQLTKVQEEMEATKDENRKLKDKNEALKEKCRSVEEQLAQTQYNCDQMMLRCCDLEEALEQTKSSCSILRKEKEALTMKCSHLKNELETCQKEKRSTEDMLVASNIQRQELTTSLQSSTVSLQSSAKERTKLQQQVDSLRGEVKKASAARYDLEKKLRASQKSESSLKEQQAKYHAMVDQLKGENSRLQEALNHDPHGKLLGELHDEVVKVGKDVETHGKGLEGVINEGLQKISKQFPDLQSLEHENRALKNKLADRDGKIKQLENDLDKMLKLSKSNSEEDQKTLCTEVKGHQQKMKEEILTFLKNQQDDEIDRQKLLSQVESLREQVRLKEEEMESAKNKMEEMSQQQASMLTDMAREREVNKEALTQAKREIAQLKNHLEEAHKQHAFKQAQSSKLVKENENMMDHLLKERLSTEEAQELTDENERLQEDNQDLREELRKESDRARQLQKRTTELLALKAPCSNVGDVCIVHAMYSGPLAHEAELEKLCWIPFGIQTLTVGEEGGLFPLQPQTTEVYKDNDVIALEVPEGAVNTAVCDRLCIRYGVIVFGPFDLPEGYQLGSMAVYIYFNQDHAVKPVVLHLPHWSGKDGESGLKCIVAPHRLEEGEEKYQFNVVEEGSSQSREVRGLITIDGHCSLFAKALKQKASLKYYASGLEKEVKDGTNLYVLITYASQIWLQILERHRSVVSSPVLFEFNSNCIQGRITSGGGKGWEAHLNSNNVVHKEDVEYSSHGIEETSDMEGAVRRRAYPPFISCKTTYSKKLKKSGEPTEVSLVIEGAKEKSMEFLCPAYKYKNAGSPQRAPSPTQELVDCTELENDSPQTPSSPPLDLSTLAPHVIRHVAANWYQLGIFLGVESTMLDTVKSDNADSTSACTAMFDKWLKCPPGTGSKQREWSTVLEAVREAVGREVANDVARSLNLSPPSSVESGLNRSPQTEPSQAPTELEENGHFNGQ